MKLEEIFELSYCINLKKRTDRWNQCQEEFKKINFYPERFNAIENENPALGCYLSHLEILKRARDANKSVLIFEDDVEVIHFEDKIIEKALDELYNMDYAMFYLGANLMNPCYQVTQHLARLTWAQSAHSYAINKKYLSQIVDLVENNLTFIDVIYAQGVCPNLPCYITVPMITIQRTGFSNIENKEMNYDIPIQRYNQHLVRMKMK
jgi:GR25 family glycosyltransferase involved in LPS biosynthesis